MAWRSIPSRRGSRCPVLKESNFPVSGLPHLTLSQRRGDLITSRRRPRPRALFRAERLFPPPVSGRLSNWVTRASTPSRRWEHFWIKSMPSTKWASICSSVNPPDRRGDDFSGVGGLFQKSKVSWVSPVMILLTSNTARRATRPTARSTRASGATAPVRRPRAPFHRQTAYARQVPGGIITLQKAEARSTCCRRRRFRARRRRARLSGLPAGQPSLLHGNADGAGHAGEKIIQPLAVLLDYRKRMIAPDGRMSNRQTFFQPIYPGQYQPSRRSLSEAQPLPVAFEEGGDQRAAAVGVGADIGHEVGDGEVVSWPTAEITSIADWKMARAVISSLKAHKSSRLPPPGTPR